MKKPIDYREVYSADECRRIWDKLYAKCKLYEQEIETMYNELDRKPGFFRRIWLKIRIWDRRSMIQISQHDMENLL